MDRTKKWLDNEARGLALTSLMENDETKAFFQHFEETAIDDIIAADTDESRAREVMRLSVCREFRVHLERIVSDGKSAAKRLTESKGAEAQRD